MTAAGGASGVEVDRDAQQRAAQALEAAASAVHRLAIAAGAAADDAASAAGTQVVAAALVDVARRCDTGLADRAARLEVAGLLLRSGADAHERDDDEGSLLFRGPPPAPR